MAPQRYKLSFTGAGLSLSASVRLAEAYLQLRDWDTVREKVWEENILQARTRTSIQRTFQELAPRLQQLSDDQLTLLVEGNHPEKKLILWLAVCKRYAFIREFAVEVLREKYLRLDSELTEYDYNVFFNRKADWHEELDRLQESTRTKIKTVLFRMLREAGLLSDNERIQPVTFSVRLGQALRPDLEAGLTVFPVSPGESLG
jgi:hypothetical protein